MPCGKVTISKNYKCDKEGCFCVPTERRPCLCLYESETGDITRCDCKCEGSKCSENCTCVSTGGYTCICVCKNEKGNIKACLGCSCVNFKAIESSGRCKCKSAQRQCVCIKVGPCKSAQSLRKCHGKACNVDCKCEHLKCICLSTGKESGVCVCNDEKGNIKTCGGCICERATRSEHSGKGKCARSSKNYIGNVCDCKMLVKPCVCKNKQGEIICCDETNTCNTRSCKCGPKESSVEKATAKIWKNRTSCVCVCENIQRKLVCCDDCKCETNTCDIKGCACMTKSSNISIPSKAVLAKDSCRCVCVCENEQGKLVQCADCNCEGNTCDKITCTCVTPGYCAPLTGSSGCKVFGNFCICKKQGKIICCDDCKCDDTNNCDKVGCICASKGSKITEEPTTSKSDGCKQSADSCICVCKNEMGENICCTDCKCDDANKCDKAGCICDSKGSKITEEPTTSDSSVCKQSADSCICVCKNEMGENTCCTDCKCDDANKCDKAGCMCASKGTKIKEQPSISDSSVCKQSADSCICVCKNEVGENICCTDCKCDDNNKCNKAGCMCASKGTKIKEQPSISDSSVCKQSADSCICVCKNEVGENICCTDCKCDDANKCDKAGCICVSKGSKITEEPTTSDSSVCKQSADSCICVCKNEVGENICCTDCKCDDANKCDKEGCICVPKESAACVEGCSSASE